MVIHTIDTQRVSTGKSPTSSRENKDQTTDKNSSFSQCKKVTRKDVDKSTRTPKIGNKIIILYNVTKSKNIQLNWNVRTVFRMKPHHMLRKHTTT